MSLVFLLSRLNFTAINCMYKIVCDTPVFIEYIERISLWTMGVYPFILFFVLLSWTGQQVHCNEPDEEETKRAEGIPVGPLGWTNCKEIECWFRTNYPYAPYNRPSQLPNQPAEWTRDDYLDAYGRCILKFNVKTDEIKCP